VLKNCQWFRLYDLSEEGKILRQKPVPTEAGLIRSGKAMVTGKIALTYCRSGINVIDIITRVNVFLVYI